EAPRAAATPPRQSGPDRERGGGAAALRRAGAAHRPHPERGHRDRRPDDPQGGDGHAVPGRGQPRSGAVPGPGPARHHAHRQSPHRLRHGHPLLSRGAAGAHGGTDRHQHAAAPPAEAGAGLPAAGAPPEPHPAGPALAAGRVVSAPAALLVALLLLAGPAWAEDAARSPTPAWQKLPARAVDVARGLEHPWGLAFLPDGRLLVTERPGRLRILAAGGALSAPLGGVPAVYARGQGGLLDVALSPGFAQDRLVYLSFSEPGPSGAGTAVARGRLGAGGLEDTQVIWRQQPKVEGPNHWGSRLVFRPDGTLFVTLGDRFAYRDRAQDLSTTLGKVVRINPDGTIPPDNPFAGRAGALPEIWSYGHRNVQAAVLDAQGRLWAVEHGARGGDEL